MATIAQQSADSAVKESGLAEAQTSGSAMRRASRAANSSPPPIAEPSWRPPDFSGSRRTRIGASVIEQFVAGHSASDVLRELVQNEFDGGGDSLSITFGSDQLEVVGNGRGITSDGWTRLSVILGTGPVMGSGNTERVSPKANGIGSKNFGLRSLFIFGDQIYVRCGGQVALLDLQTQETGREPDSIWQREKGVRVRVAFRHAPAESLEAFTVEREQHAFELMATRMPATLVKLALGGKKSGLREVTLRSIRTGRTLRWRQDAKVKRCRARGVSVISRSGRLTDRRASGEESRTTFQEAEYSRSVDIPADHAGRGFPAYYQVAGDRLKIAVSLPIARGHIDTSQPGHFYYPLQTPDSRTGCAVSVSAPFELNTDRSSLVDNRWNDWLIDQAVELTIDLLKADWFERYGVDAYKVLIANGSASADRFSKEITRRLAQDACWPTRGKDEKRYSLASHIVLSGDPSFDGFLTEDRYLDPLLSDEKILCDLVAASGAKTFSLSSLVRLRCAGQNRNSLKTQLSDRDADFHYTNYEASLKGIDLQVQLAKALSEFTRRLTKEQKADLANTESTLSGAGQLRSARNLIIVERDIWGGCPEPEANRLHPDLIACKAIAGHCRRFDEEQWLIDAAERAASAADDDPEREVLYNKLLSHDAPINRRVLTALRKNPVVKNQHGAWAAPADMVMLRGQLARFMAAAIDMPSKAMLEAPNLIGRLRIRDSPNGTDLVRYAAVLHERPETAERFEKLLFDHIRLLSSAVVDQLRNLPCLTARSGKRATPATLHFDTSINRICIGDNDRIVAGGNEILHRKLRVREFPHSDTLLATIKAACEKKEEPTRSELLYPALVDAITRERRPKLDLVDTPICWVQDGYHAPSEILVGQRIPLVLRYAFPIHRHSDEIGRAYIALGAPAQAGDEHWARFFRHVATEWGPLVPLDDTRRRALLEAYHTRGSNGLPDGLSDIACLLDDRGRLFTHNELVAGRLVEPDFPLLQRALLAADSKTGIVARSERSRTFFSAIGIRPLSSIAGTGRPVFGSPARPSFWYKPHHREGLLAMLRKPLFARALYEIAYAQRHSLLGFLPADLATLKERVEAISDITFFASIVRRYDVAGASVEVQTDVAVGDSQIGVVPPKTKQDFQFLLAEALAEIAGATNAALARNLANALLPLVLCTSPEAMRVHLDRIGLVDHDQWGFDNRDEFEAESEFTENLGEEVLRQVMHNLNTRRDTEPETVSKATTDSTDSWTPSLPPTPQSSPPSPPPFTLPDIDDVDLTVAPTASAQVEGRGSSSGEGGGGAGVWMPRTPSDVERDGQVGRRGEQLVYRMELRRVRAMGHANAEELVVWTSLTEPGADHDIRSIDEKGQPKWIEVKSTTGVDGRFDWPRKEFEKALRERERYELWRVYHAAERAPIAKCFRNPAQMIGASQIALELGTLRASVEGLMTSEQ